MSLENLCTSSSSHCYSSSALGTTQGETFPVQFCYLLPITPLWNSAKLAIFSWCFKLKKANREAEEEVLDLHVTVTSSSLLHLLLFCNSNAAKKVQGRCRGGISQISLPCLFVFGQLPPVNHHHLHQHHSRHHHAAILCDHHKLFTTSLF